MGNFLDTPITEKETEVGSDAKTNLSYGLSAMQGWRAQMEDDHVQQLSLEGHPDVSLFGVYDGHGGDMVAHYVANHITERLKRHLPPAQLPEADVPAQSKLAFEKALMEIDTELRHLPEVESGQDQSGSTSVMTLISKEYVVCANTGDSRAVLCRGGQAVALSHDHKPYNTGEKERIEAAGSHVKFNRVNGDLAVSRALGDFVYKRCETVADADQAVTAFPDVIVEKRQAASDEVIVLACDGIWDVMSSQEVCDKVKEMLINGRPPPPPPDPSAEAEDGAAAGQQAAPPPPRPWDLGAVAECLIDHCLRLGSRDNMSVIVVLMDPKFKPQPESDEAVPMQVSAQAPGVSSSSSGGGTGSAGAPPA